MTTTALLLLLKPIADMFYQLPVLDYALMGLAFLALIINVKRIKHVYFIDSISLAFVMVLTFTLVRTDFQGAIIYIKIVSAFILYFIGRSCGERLYRERRFLVYSELFVLLVNSITLITKSGFQTWGHTTTFSGLYYFKTDLALSMIYVVITLLYFGRFKKSFLWITCILSTIMLFLSNTRMGMLIILIIIGVFFLFIREEKTNKQLQINLKYVGVGIVALFGGIIIISNLLKLQAFQKFNYITFSFNNVFDLYNAGNTSGRNVVWAAIINTFNNKPLWERIIGIDFVSDYYITYDSHNAYLKILFSTGYLGLALFVLFLFLYMARLNTIQNRYLFYFNLSALITFLLLSLSASTIEYTQSTWVFMMLLGASVSQSSTTYKEPYKTKKRRIQRA